MLFLLCDKTELICDLLWFTKFLQSTLWWLHCCWAASRWFTAICHVLKLLQNSLLTCTKELSMKSEMVHLLCQMETLSDILKSLYHLLKWFKISFNGNLVYHKSNIVMKRMRKSFHHILKVFILCSDYNCIILPLGKSITLKICWKFSKQLLNKYLQVEMDYYDLHNLISLKIIGLIAYIPEHITNAKL